MIKFIKYIGIVVFIFLSFFLGTLAVGEAENKVNLLIFSREDCSHCVAEKEFLKTLGTDINITEIKLENPSGQAYFKQITEKFNISKVTPITLIGDSIIIGFDGGKDILNKIKIAKEQEKYNLDINYYLNGGKKSVATSGDTCGDVGITECKIEDIEPINNINISKKEEVSFFGSTINFKDFSLFSISAVLGFVDGFNPCAMWVLLTFLIVLSQIKDRKKMAYLAGTFIFAEGVMYFIILNIWSSAWDFIGYQKIVTMIIGVVAVVMGLYFIRKYFKNRNNFTYDVTSAEHQNKITTKIQNIAQKPLTIISIISILFLAFSVNIIEFACSAGIPQTFTKILDINNLSFFMEQMYIGLYTLMYMADDFLVFGLALWGYKNFYNVGVKYSNISTLIAGVLISILGIFLIFFPTLLVF